MRWVGIDAHRDFAHVTELTADGPGASYRVTLDPDGLADLKGRLGPDAHVVLEASTSTFRLVDELKPHAGRVVVAHPSQTRGAGALHAKTDRRDSEVLAHLLKTDFVREVWVPGPGLRTLRGLVEYRHSLAVMARAMRTRLKSFLNQQMIRPPVPRPLLTVCGRRFLEELELAFPDHRDYVDSLARVHDAVEAEVCRLDHRLVEWCGSSADAKLLFTIPGFGPVVTATLLSQIGDIRRFADPRQLCAYAGIVPRVHQSGAVTRRGSISRRGRSLMRWALSIAVPHVVSRTGRLQDFHRQLLERRPKRVAHVACARKILTIIWRMLTERRPYREQVPHLSARKLGAAGQ